MARHEKKAFFKFFITYFVSVALLILAVGFFYFQQMSLQLIKAEHFSLIEYARHIKIEEDISAFSKEYHHRYLPKNEYFEISNFTETATKFIKKIPLKSSENYLEVAKSKQSYETKLYELKTKIIFVQSALLLFFASLSFLLARSALRPLKKSFEMMENFTKDLIHDLGTPTTAMKLNLKILQNINECKEHKAFERLEKSVATVADLHLNLTTLLENKTFQIQAVELCHIVDDLVELHKHSYPDISFENRCGSFEIKANENAMKQVLQNLISNGCKYNKQNGYIKIYTQGKKRFCIENSGNAIEDTAKIFQRKYSTHNSSGLGLDIVKRLCDAMGIKVEVSTIHQGNIFVLTFP
ncbi:MAG: HAMP domain-containing sensor histidine kinase [Sulfurimonas sp.]